MTHKESVNDLMELMKNLIASHGKFITGLNQVLEDDARYRDIKVVFGDVYEYKTRLHTVLADWFVHLKKWGSDENENENESKYGYTAEQLKEMYYAAYEVESPEKPNWGDADLDGYFGCDEPCRDCIYWDDPSVCNENCSSYCSFRMRPNEITVKPEQVDSSSEVSPD